MRDDDRQRSLEEVRAGVVERLRSRRVEIEQAIFARVRDELPDPLGGEDAEYVAGLAETVTAVVDYGLTGIEQGEEWSGPVPPAAVAQAHRAARGGVALETVLRRYVAGHALLGDFVTQETAQGGFPDKGDALRSVQSTQVSLLERVMDSIADEYTRESERTRRSPEQRRAERVRRLLAGGPVDTAELHYELDAWHLGVIATGAGAWRAVRGLAAGMDRELLSVPCGQETVWAWLGGPRSLAGTDIERISAGERYVGTLLAVGEPRRGLGGWRLTHRQAQVALSVALREPRRLTRFVDVALVAPWLQNEAMAQSLVDVFLAPLDDRGCSGATLRETLRAYFDAGLTASAAAKTLGISRRTMRNRLEMIEEGLGSMLHKRQAELELALRLDALLPAAPAAACPPR
jgi:DNA-binding XRE family transcriptional regulator